MIFRKPAQPYNKSSLNGNPFVSMLADTYLRFLLTHFDEAKVREMLRGKFASLKYSLSGFDPSELPYGEKVKLINALYDFSLYEVGPIEARGTLEELGLKVKERLGSQKSFEEGLADLPEGIFEIQRLKTLSREELEKRARECLIEIHEARSSISKTAAERSMKLEAERDVLEAILYNASDGVFALDRSSKILTFNKAMETLTGYTFEEVERSYADEYIRIFDATVPLEAKNYSTGKPTHKDKLTLVRRNGEKRFIEMKSTPIAEGREVNIGCVVTLTDVTKDIDLEKMKLDFVSIAAHELRTPLTSLRGYLSLIDDDSKSTIGEKYAGYIEKAVLSADRLHGLVENLLNITRIEKGTLTINKTRVDWVSLVKEVIEEAKIKSEEANIQLNFEDPLSKIPPIYADQATVVEVLSNLLDNAIKYTPEGGKVTVTIDVDKDFVTTHVKDTGVGIPPASIPHLFKKFYRVSTTVLRAGEKGTGLGLFISKEIITRHNGKIWVESEVEKGSTFSFSLPIKQDD